MTEPGIQSTWAMRELPILRSALRRFDGGDDTKLTAIHGDTDLTAEQFEIALTALASADPPYVSLYLLGGGGSFVDGVSERARRELGSWPSGDAILEQLIAALRQTANDETERERKGRLQSAADVLAGMARDIAVNVISARIGQV